YFTWPDGNLLLQALQLAPSTDDDVLKPYLKNSFIDAIRKTAGTHTWHEVNEDRAEFARGVLKAIKGDKENPTPFYTIGFTQIDVNITDIGLPEELKKAVAGLEQSRLDKHAAFHKAMGERKVIEERGKGEAVARKEMLKVVQEAGLDYELLFSFREFAQGTSNTIIYQLPQALSDRISNILGGTSIEDAFRKLKPEDQTKIMEALTKQLSKVKKGE
ncbi:MAG: hypothetical protein DRH10_10375, partial [Deltaproteobacteria bacterium]